jgi:hypothetical protein
MRLYKYMRTSIDIPDDLFKMAKMAAAERGTTMRELVVKGLRHEVCARGEESKGVMRHLGSLAHLKAELQGIQAMLDEERKIEPEAWQ